MVYSCSGAEQEYTMVWFGIFLYLLISSLKIRFCEQSVFAKSPLLENYLHWILNLSFAGVPARLCVGGPSQPVVVEDGVRANLGFQNKLEIVGEMVKMVGVEMVQL